MQALARFLPSLASTKESKLSKHTIVDESLKYHELQQTKLDELQRSFDALTAEKEELLAEVSTWRQCLDVQPQTLPAELCEADVVQTTGASATIDNSNSLYGGTTAAGCDRPLDALATADVPGSDLLPTDFFDDYAMQPPQTQFQTNPDIPNIPANTQQFSQDNHHIEPPHTNLWPPLQPVIHPQQTYWTHPSFHDIPLEFR